MNPLSPSHDPGRDAPSERVAPGRIVMRALRAVRTLVLFGAGWGVFSGIAGAATISWVGPTTGAHLWSAESNWQGGRVPGPTDDVRIQGEGLNLSVRFSGVATIRSLDTTCTLRIVSDIGVNAHLAVSESVRNQGHLRLESERADRTATLTVTGAAGLENNGSLTAAVTGGGERRIRAGIVNRGRLQVEAGVILDVDNADRLFEAVSGQIEVLGSLRIDGGRVIARGGQVNGDIRVFSAETWVAPTWTSPGHLRLLGALSSLVSNDSATMTLELDTDVGNQTTLTTRPGAVNVGRLVMGSARDDRVTRLRIDAGLTNAPTGLIEVVAGGGGGRFIDGTLVNQGRLTSLAAPVTVTGTYQVDGGRADGDVRFVSVRLLTLRAPAGPNELQLFGGETTLVGEVLTNLVLRVISDTGAQATLTVSSNTVNLGVIRLESQRADRTSTLNASGLSIVNRGAIEVLSANGGARRFRGSLTNLARVFVETGVRLDVENRNAVFAQNSGGLEVAGSMDIVGGRVDVAGGSLSGDIRLFGATTRVAASVTTPATLWLLGVESTLIANSSPVVTLYLDTDVGNQTTLTTLPGAVNVGRIVMGSARNDRLCRLELAAGFTNAPSGIIEIVRAGGGDRRIQGTLINQGLLLAESEPVTVSGTYQVDGGRAVGDVLFQSARIVPTRPTAVPSELRLYGAASELDGDNLENLLLRVISDIEANAVLTVSPGHVNRGSIRMESLRADRTTVLRVTAGFLENGDGGTIVTDGLNGGGREIRSPFRNRGVVTLGHPLLISGSGAQHVNEGFIALGGHAMTVSGSTFVNAQGARILGPGTLDVRNVAFANSGILSPGETPGRLAILGNYTHATTGVLDIEIASGAGPGTGHDLVAVTNGAVTLQGGTLSTRLRGEFVPDAEARFRFLTASGGVTGRFARTPNLQVHPNRHFQVDYLPNAVELRTLTGVNAALPPSIVTQPASQTIAESGAATFSVAVNGSGPFTYQWRRNGAPIPGATGATLSLPRVQAADFGEYDVVVSNAAGSSTSDPAQLNKSSGGEQESRDFGDAPDLPYPTTRNHGGASQRVLAGFTLGGGIDPDDGTLQNSTATADGADEDGVRIIGSLIPGQAVTVRVIHTRPPGQNPGRLSAWMDWNANGAWADPAERIISHAQLVPGTNDFVVVVPAAAVIGTTFSRYRLYQDQYPGVTGDSEESGEVEDYQVEITREGGGGGGGENGATHDFGDLPDSYRTLLASDGARHLRIPGLYFGKLVDVETNGVPGILAVGDDLSGQPDDEDGVTGSPLFRPGGFPELDVTVVGAGKVDAWFDFNRNGTFADPGEWVLVGEAFSTETRSFKIPVPGSAVPGGSYARFRLSHQGLNSWFGPAPEGEVEDYPFVILAPEKDWGDAPDGFPTRDLDDGARHTLAEGFHLGKTVDSEADGQPNSNATGDDLSPPGEADDEDGVTFTTPLVRGQTAEVRVEASADGRLDAWIDFGGDRGWGQGGDRIFTARALLAGVNVLSFNVPATAVAGPTYARFRLSRSGLNTHTGDGGEGEVEDHRVVIEEDPGCELSCTGQDFWFTFPGNYAPDPANPVAPRIRVTGTSGTTVTVSIPGLGTNLTATLAGTGITLVLPAAVDLGDLNDAIRNRGIHVTATAPVGVQAISRVAHTTDGFRALPTEVLSGEYVVAAFPNTQVGVPEISGTQFALVATQPNTTVVITPRVETGPRIAGVPYSIVLTNVGDCYQLRNTNDAPADLTGTLIEADQPVAALGGHLCANVNSSSLFYCDYLVEQLLPVERLGTEFFTAPLATRTGGETVRVVAARNNTTLTVNGGSPIVLTNRGDVYETLLTQAGHFVANRPVLVHQYASSSDRDGVVNSDPFMVTVPGRSHFAASHAFATGGTNFLTHHVTVIAPSSVTSLTLDGVVTNVVFTPIAATGFRYARLGVTQGNHTLSGSADLGVIVYGWSEYESYAWPGCLFFGDTTPPRITCRTNSVTVRIGQFGDDVPCKTRVPDFRALASYQDNCGISPQAPVRQEPAPGTLVGVGRHEVTLSVADNRGNVGSCPIILNVVDPDPDPAGPISLTCPDDFTVRCDDETGRVVRYEVEALRGCTPIAVECSPPSGSRFPLGTTVVTCRIVEAGVAIRTCSFRVTVDCRKERKVKINPVVRPAPTAQNPNPPAEIVLEWEEESGTILEVADSLDGPWVAVPTNQGKHVIQVLQERGKFFRLRAP
ncbi:MAG: GEVED domain-containing protein [Limisphaerales bacterium]